MLRGQCGKLCSVLIGCINITFGCENFCKLNKIHLVAMALLLKLEAASSQLILIHHLGNRTSVNFAVFSTSAIYQHLH